MAEIQEMTAAEAANAEVVGLWRRLRAMNGEDSRNTVQASVDALTLKVRICDLHAMIATRDEDRLRWFRESLEAEKRKTAAEKELLLDKLRQMDVERGERDSAESEFDSFADSVMQ